MAQLNFRMRARVHPDCPSNQQCEFWQDSPTLKGFSFVFDSFFFLWLFAFLAMPPACGIFSSPTRDLTHAPCSGSSESQPLDLQGSPNIVSNKMRRLS